MPTASAQFFGEIFGLGLDNKITGDKMTAE
jgi:hypothetical protein